MTLDYTLKVKIKNFFPQDFCFQCMFCRANNYGESLCMLNGLEKIDLPEYSKPEWCPFNDAEEE